MRQVFLTGGSGTIGSALVPRLLAAPQTQVTLLLRATDAADLQQRLQSLHNFWGHAVGDPRRELVNALRGDISAPGLGLQPAEVDALADRTSHIIHCAASVKLNMSAEQASSTAVAPTRAILDLARRCARSGLLQKVDLVSTVGVWGRSPGVMPERRLPEVDSFHNTYEAAKAEAERVVWSEGDGLPITVHRPSMVVGRTGDGQVMHFQVFYHLCEFLSGGRTFGIMPKLGHTRLDTVPVDWVANAIAWASETPSTAGRILHLCAGPEQAIAITELQQLVRQTWQQHGRKLPRLRTLSSQWLERLIPVIGALGGQRTRRALRGLPPVLAYLAEDQGFSNTDSHRLLAAACLPLPAVRSYLPAVLAHYLGAQRRPAAA
jgi:thioester reductase-like protein